MSLLRSRTALSPLRRRVGAAAAALPAVDDIVAVTRPEAPLVCVRPEAVTAAARDFVAGFPGEVLYAVKCNPEPAVLRALWAGGVRHFDCASAAEVALVRRMFPRAAIHFMHPVKSRGAIREAWATHGVRDFVLDHADELTKIREETGAGAAEGLGLFVRLALPAGGPGNGVMYDLSGKFGADVEETAALLRAARPHAARLGVSFHVGSQCMDPLAWRRALQLVGEAVALAGVTVEVVDVGGGFPVSYPGMEPPPQGAFFAEIESAFEALALPGAVLWAEPGRALVAAGGSVVVQVQLRRGDALYLNDGVYGCLSDMGMPGGAPGFRFPVRLIRPDADVSEEIRDFVFFGPTCDSADRMRGPFPLPADAREGDWIEIAQLGAYGACLRTAFNGFDGTRLVEVRGEARGRVAEAVPV
ncbi:type III PLP-dependent enzyme [Roseomonas sp. NAR14]|uniref:ornithine decarboxylase n=1 Tax=Roseomonas acroporae TaxID=2937791 RepID=A0A9X1YI02_9PROT|nr:type III PLP-dependent enzyme [Roseomonas acroporae]MCK8786526.1 type III PLP-dependent enzyme [Roseomonas acroporae]